MNCAAVRGRMQRSVPGAHTPDNRDLYLKHGACTRPYPNPLNIPTSNAARSPTSAVSLPIVPVAPIQVPTGLTVNEVALQGAPSTDAFGFTPVEGTMEEILARNAARCARSFPTTRPSPVSTPRSAV